MWHHYLALIGSQGLRFRGRAAIALLLPCLNRARQSPPTVDLRSRMICTVPNPFGFRKFPETWASILLVLLHHFTAAERTTLSANPPNVDGNVCLYTSTATPAHHFTAAVRTTLSANPSLLQALLNQSFWAQQGIL